MTNNINETVREFFRTMLSAIAAVLLPTMLLGIDTTNGTIDINWGVLQASALFIFLTSLIKAINEYLAMEQDPVDPYRRSIRRRGWRGLFGF